jgi:hypothetical protein
MLPIINYNEPFDFQKKGNYLNWKVGLPIAPQDSLLSWQFYEDGDNLTVYKAHKVVVQGTDVKILDSIDLIGINPPTKENTKYFQKSFSILSSNLENGVYFFEISDGNFIKKSELFCIREGFVVFQTGLIFNIFSNLGYNLSKTKTFDSSGNGYNFTLTNGRALQVNFNTIFYPQNHFNLKDFTVLNAGTAKLEVSNNQIIVTRQGTVYGMQVVKSGFFMLFPVIENHFYLHDVNYNERLTVVNAEWTNQDDYFWLKGMQRLTDSNYNKHIYIPYNQFVGYNYNATKGSVTNRWQPNVTYTLNEIIYYDKLYYKCITPHVSTQFLADIANWQLI